MKLARRKSRQARVVDKLRDVTGGRRKSTPARMRDKVKKSGVAKTAEGAGMAGRAAGRSGKTMVVYAGRKAEGKRAPLLVGVPVLIGTSIASVIAMRKMRQGAKQTVA